MNKYKNLKELMKFSGIEYPLAKNVKKISEEKQIEMPLQDWKDIPGEFKTIKEGKKYLLSFGRNLTLREVSIKEEMQLNENMEDEATRFDEYNTAVETWFERDRAYVGLYPKDDEGKPDTNQDAIVEWWDDDVRQAIENGFLDPKDYHKSAVDYAKHLGVITEKKHQPIDIGDGFTVTRVGHDVNGNWSYWVKKGDGPAKKIQHTGNLAGRKAVNLEELSRNDSLKGEIKKYYKEYILKEAKSEDAEDATVFTNNKKSVDDSEESMDRFGISTMRDEKVKVPKEVLSKIDSRINELKQSIRYYDRKGYNDGQGANSNKIKAIDALQQIKKHISKNNLEGLKQAQIFFGTLMSPITDLLPGIVVNYIVNGNDYENDQGYQPVKEGKELMEGTKLEDYVNKYGSRKAAMKLVDQFVSALVGLSVEDLPDTATLANGLDGIVDAIEAKDFHGAIDIARDTAREMVEEEGGGDLL